jgi:hypothetical protein
MNHLHSSHETGLIVRCHFDASPKRWWRWQHKKAFKNWLLASLIAQLLRHLLFLYILKDVCEGQGNWISTFLIKLFLIHGSATTGKIAIPQYDGCRRTAYFHTVNICDSTLMSSPSIRQYLKLATSCIALCSVVCEMPDLQSLSSIRSPFVSAIVNLT